MTSEEGWSSSVQAVDISMSQKCFLRLGICISILIAFILTDSVSDAYENCQTLTTEMVITKEKTYAYNGRPLRLLCVGTVNIRKCEGTCNSQVSPSVVKFPGFLKDCRCCRESSLEDRLVTLSECYDGSTLIRGEKINMYIKEPSGCNCYDCTM